MKPHPRTSKVQRAGTLLGKAWRKVVHREKQLRAWLIERGVPAPATTVLLWIAKLVALGVLLYAAFWLALLLVFAIAVAWAAENADWDDEDDRPQWRNGLDGFGLYRGGVRIDPGGQDED